MRFRNAAFVAIASLLTQLMFPVSGTAEFVPTIEDIPPEQIVNSVTTTHDLVLATFYRVIVEGKIVGALLVYGNPKTKRPKDYLELYDNETNLVAVGWFDRFGIQRIAIDRGLFEDGPKLQGVFVTLLDGDPL
jgi:hypothetical protein